MNVFDLMAKLTLDKSEYESGLDTAEQSAGNFASKFASGMGTAAKAGALAIGALGTGVAVASKAFINGAGDVAEYGDKIDKASQKIGISAQAYQEWDFIAQHSGTSMDTLKTSFKTLANQAQSGAEEFKKIGLSLDDVAKMSTEDLFSAVVSGLQNMEEGTERTAVASKLLGRGALELGALLNTSAEDTEAMRKQVHDLGGVMSDEGVKAAARYQDSLQNMQTSMAGLKNNLMGTFLPSIADVMDGLAAMFSGDSSGMQAVNRGIDNMVQLIADGAPKVLEVGGQLISALAEAIMENLPKIIDAASDVSLTLVQSLISGLPDILQSGIQIIGSLVDGLTEALPDLIPAAVDAIITIAENLVENVDKIIEAAGKIILALGSGLIKALPKLVSKLPEIGKAILKGLASIPKAVFDIGVHIVEGLWEGIKSVGSWIGDKVGGFFGGIVDGVKGFLGIHSPSRLFAQLGQFTAEGFGEGFDDKFADVKKAMEDEMQFDPQNIPVGEITYTTASANSTNALLNSLINAVNGMSGQQIILDTGVLVGQTVSKMDTALGQLANKNMRGVLA